MSPITDISSTIIVDIDGTIVLHKDEQDNLLRGHYEYDKVDGDF